jgi:spore germination protein KC
MNKRKRFLAFLLTILAILSITGCWSAQEINNLAIIHMVGVDEDSAGDVTLTVSVVKPNMLFSQGAGTPGNPEESFLINTATGKNLFEAMGKLSSVIPEKIYLGHVNAVVFGEKAARNRMTTSLDFFKRQNDFRPSIQLFVTKGLAEDIVKKTPSLNPTLASELYDLALNSRFSSTKMLKDISKFTDALTSDTIDPITAVINTPTEKQQIKVEKTPSKREPNAPNKLSLYETAAFKGSKLQGFLTQEETRGLLWIRGELEKGHLILACGSSDPEGKVGLNLRKSTSTMIPTLSDDQLKMEVNIQAEADIVEVTCKDFSGDTAQIEKLNKQFEAKIRAESLKTLSIAQQQWETDIFGFGRAIYRKYPAQWDHLAPGWRKGGLKSLDVELNVSGNISRYGLLKEQSKANESR